MFHENNGSMNFREAYNSMSALCYSLTSFIKTPNIFMMNMLGRICCRYYNCVGEKHSQCALTTYDTEGIARTGKVFDIHHILICNSCYVHTLCVSFFDRGLRTSYYSVGKLIYTISFPSLLFHATLL